MFVIFVVFKFQHYKITNIVWNYQNFLQFFFRKM